jgi:SAM-dependent methyltransferase
VGKWFSDFSEVNHIDIPTGILHRKSWEYAYIALALQERGCLKRGKRGLGFAVGTEPLPAFFASRGCSILATDLFSVGNNWAAAGQNVNGNIEALNSNGICPEGAFKKRVQLMNLDMNNVPSELNDFDFCWSSCAIEHVGNLEKSKRFLKTMLKVLKPGGIAVHTTEFNLTSDEETVTEGESVIYRKKDILEFAEWLTVRGHEISLDFSPGDMEGDRFVDQPPYYQLNPKYHLHLNLLGYESTSIGLIIKKSDC